MAKNKKKKQRKLSALLLLLFLSVVLLSTSTYAWFTANKNVSIEDIDINVEASGGIQISADATAWKTVVSKTDLSGTKTGNYTASKNQLPGVLVASSTDGTVATGGYMDMYIGTVKADADGDFALSATKSTGETHGSTGEYIAFDIFIKNDNETATPIYLTPGSGAKVTTSKDDKGLQNATRIAFVNEGNVDKTKTAADAQALNGGTTSVIYEPYANSHTAYGVLQANTYYAKNVGAVVLKADDSNTAIPTHGLKAAIAESDAIKLAATNKTDNSTTFAEQSTTVLSKTFVEGSGSALAFTTLAPGVTKFRVYMWIEGQDVDCENNASGSYLTFSIGFTSVAPAGA